MYLEANKQQTKYRLTYFEVSKMENWYGCCFEVQIIASKINGTFLVLTNKQHGVLPVFRV